MTRDEAPDAGQGTAGQGTAGQGTAGQGTAGKAKRPLLHPSVANQARIYDYLLGGKDNYEVDRAATKAILAFYPGMAFNAKANRAFLGRAVHFLASEAGIRQFLDIGTGIPTAGNTHQVAQAVAPESHVVYVDYDPVVLSHARALLTSHEAGATRYVDADLRDTDTVLRQARQLLDFTKPVAITLLAILHAVPDADDPHGIVATLLDAVPAGSYLAVSHIAADLLDAETQQEMTDVSDRMVEQDFSFRTRDQVTRFFAGTDLVPPGVVRVEEWRPEPGPKDKGKSSLWAGIGRKR
jgi:S-adenosyl methyltransferase